MSKDEVPVQLSNLILMVWLLILRLRFLLLQECRKVINFIIDCQASFILSFVAVYINDLSLYLFCEDLFENAFETILSDCVKFIIFVCKFVQMVVQIFIVELGFHTVFL